MWPLSLFWFFSICRGSCSALSAMCHTGLPSPDGCQSSRSQAATRLGIKVEIFFIVWKRGAWLMQMAAPKAQSPGDGDTLWGAPRVIWPRGPWEEGISFDCLHFIHRSIPKAKAITFKSA
uniref:Secreted protein n=1 Tax=Zonotrichia albicollis TaxID=44394 RepID=A0A8D2MN73_ZONAL